MTDSILTSIKKLLNLDEDNTDFDMDVVFHINDAFGTLRELGIGPTDGFEIEDASATWTDFLEGNLRYVGVKQYIYLKVRLIFDPPTTSYQIQSFNEKRQELESRLSMIREETDWVAPVSEEVTWTEDMG